VVRRTASHNFRGSHEEIQIKVKLQGLGALGCTRSLADFAKIVEIFDAAGVSFVSVTQQFNTTTSMGTPTLNVLLSFAQFEREVTGERNPPRISELSKANAGAARMPECLRPAALAMLI
jgi:hypothetical protein